MRERWTDLTGVWRFAYDDDDAGLAERWFGDGPERFDRSIQVPYPPESKLSGIHDPTFHPVLWYQRDLETPAIADGERLLLHFGAVDYRASIWLNGQHVVDHEGGHTPFSADITDAIDPARDQQSLVVRAEDRPTDVSQPRGKQAWAAEPSRIWYHRTSGIWQPVWLEIAPATRLGDVVFTADLTGDIDVQVTIDGQPSAAATVEVTITRDGEVYASHTASVSGPTAAFRVSVPAVQRDHTGAFTWRPDSPTLFDANVVLRAGDLTDTVHSYVGFRRVSVRDNRFVLNRNPYFQRLVLEQGYWPESHLAAPDADALRREVELIKELGFNGVRIHQKVEDPRFLYWCDRLGLLVWGEMANAHEFSDLAVDRLTREWAEAVRRDRSHPCIVAWVPLNESWGVPEIATSPRQQSVATGLVHLTKALDPTRPVISNDGWEHTESDIVSIHDYTPSGAVLRDSYGDPDAMRSAVDGVAFGRKILVSDRPHVGCPVVISEFGGLSFGPSGDDKWFGYAVADTAENFREQFEDLVTALLDARGLAGFCYTQLTDTLQENNGLLTAEREPKLPLAVIREIVTRSSRSIPQELVAAARQRARSRYG
ncbi:sugar-binding domain-containing protein [Phytoactinopolyspora endophytica]|uniref:sugar-binding domain-containing protein n=1 Tax=Phytoactinopolyspora endophytica TaxID=1642495 RepID=UPI00197BCB23|nr:sugar-binding domain-containing protein [Phytoactinopolyspora endophytica]